MNRHNFFGHLALAIAAVMLAAFMGQMRRMGDGPVRGTFVKREILEQVEPHAGPEIEAADAEDAEVIVRFRAGISTDEIERLTARLNDRLEDRFEFINNEAVIADEDDLSAEAVAAEYSALPEVLYAEPNYEINLSPVEDEEFLEAEGGDDGDEDDPPVIKKGRRPNDQMFAEQWSLTNEGQRGGKAQADISAALAWEKTTGSEKIVVAVLDTGVDYTHRDLFNNIWTRPNGMAPYTDEHLGSVNDRHGYDAADNDGDPMDDNGHGTHCAGIIGAEGDNSEGIAGVNWKVEIMPLKFLSRGGSGTTKDAIEAINYAMDRKKAGVNIRIISASWGSTARSRALGDAIKRASEEGILFIAAAGNSRTNNDRIPHFPSSYDLPNVVAVAALNRRDELASFSNYGLKSVHIGAPGAEILSTWPGDHYEEHSGTSMATPVVSGVAALVLSANPKMSMAELRAHLLDSVDPLPALKGKVSTGGRINAARAVRAE
ncbi:MAG: S8 family serine peptidase [Acidobacteriota bacterium]|nr:S8 family serine peptidase [Acidobacteriota bacterium]